MNIEQLLDHITNAKSACQEDADDKERAADERAFYSGQAEGYRLATSWLRDTLEQPGGFRTVKMPPADMADQWGLTWNLTPLGTFQARTDGSIELRDDYEHTYTPDEIEKAAVAMLAAVEAARRLADEQTGT